MNAEYLFEAPREYLVLNGGEDYQELQYDGESPRCPPSDVVIPVDPKNPTRPHSGKNSLGEYIPGSLIIRDIYGYRGCPDDVNNEGRRGEYWSARECLKHALGIDPTTKLASGILAQKGIAVLPLNPSPDMVRVTREECRANYVLFMEKWAQNTIFAYEQKASKRKGAGFEDTIPGKDYDRAVVILRGAKQRRAAEKAELEGVLGLAEPVEASSEDEAQVFARQMAEEAAYSLQKDKPEVDMDAVVEHLMQNPKFKQSMKEKYALRKRRTPKASATTA